MATYYAVPAGGSWTDRLTWKTLSNDAGVNPPSYPQSNDTCILDDHSGDVYLGAINNQCADLLCDGYTNTLTWTAATTLSVTVSITYCEGMTMDGADGTARLYSNGSTYRSNGITHPCKFQVGSGTHTFLDDWTFTGRVTVDGYYSVSTFNGSTLYLNGGFSASNDGGSTSLTGTSIIQINAGTCVFEQTTIGTVHFKFNGDMSFTGWFYAVGTTITWISGTPDFTGFVLRLQGATLDTSSMMWGSLTFYTETNTLLSDLNSNGTLTLTYSTTLNGPGCALRLNTAGLYAASAGISGTAKVIVSGTSGFQPAFCGLESIEIDSVGTVTLNAAIQLRDSCSFIHTSGTLSPASRNFTIANTGKYTLHLKTGTTWDGFVISAIPGSEIEIDLVHNYEPTATARIWINPGVILTFSSASTISVVTLEIPVGTTANPTTLILSDASAFAVTGHFDTAGSLPNAFNVIKSLTPGSYATFNVNGTEANHVCGCTRFTDIDQSGGARPLQTWLGGATHCLNIRVINRSSFKTRGLSIHTTS
jgi:hypothetical protein